MSHSKLYIKIFGVIILVPCILIFLFPLAIENLKARYFYLTVCLFSVAATVIASYSKRKYLLEKIEGVERNLAIGKMKFFAEVAAAFSLMVFLGPYYLTGLELDKNSKQEQWEHFKVANKLIKNSMTAEYCSMFPYRTLQCDSVREKMKSLSKDIIFGVGESSYKIAEDIIRELENFEVPNGSMESTSLNEAKRKLNILDLRDSWATRILATLPLFASLFASMAVSSKVALAWVEWSTRKAEQKKMKKKVHLENLRLKAEAARKEQLKEVLINLLS